MFTSLRKALCALLVCALCFAVNLVWVLAVRIEPFSDYEP